MFILRKKTNFQCKLKRSKCVNFHNYSPFDAQNAMQFGFHSNAFLILTSYEPTSSRNKQMMNETRKSPFHFAEPFNSFHNSIEMAKAKSKAISKCTYIRTHAYIHKHTYTLCTTLFNDQFRMD